MNFSLALPEEICTELGHRVRARRLMLNISAQELGQRAGLSTVTLSNLERTGKCTLETFIRVLEVLGATNDLESVLIMQSHSIEDMKAKEATQSRKRNSGNERT